MLDTLGRVIRRVPAGTASTSNLFADLQALDSGAAQIFLTSDLNLLGDESTYRTLASVPGFLDVSRPSPTGATSPLSPSDFDWSGRFEVTPSPACVCFGTHVIHRSVSDSAVWPDVVLRARVEPPAAVGEKLGAILVAAPGVNALAAIVTSPTLYAVTSAAGGGGSWVDLDIRLPLTGGALSSISTRPMLGAPSSGVPGDSEIVNAFVTTLWASFFSTSGKCQVVAITVDIEPSP